MLRGLTFLIISWTVFAFCFASDARSKRFGVGAIVGAPTGVSGAYRLSEDQSIDAALGWSLGDDVNYHIHSTFLLHRPEALEIDEIPLDIYFGIGARIKDRDTSDEDDDFRLGARAPLGVHHMFDDPSVEVFAEVALILDVIESTKLDFNLALGGRFWF